MYLSIIIPCFNSEKTLIKCIHSIIDENIQEEYEVIFVDDGSKDKTSELLRKFSNNYSNFIMYTFRKNCGGGCARNFAISQSKGEYIFMLDSDNYLEPGSLTKLIEQSKKTNSSIFTFEKVAYFSDVNQKKKKPLKFKKSTYDITDVITSLDVPIHSGNYLFSIKSFGYAGAYEEDLGAMDTFTFGFKQLLCGCSLEVVKDTSYNHRIDLNSYWIREEKSKNNEKNLRKFFLDNITEFSIDSRKKIRSLSEKDKITDLIKNKQLKLKKVKKNARKN